MDSKQSTLEGRLKHAIISEEEALHQLKEIMPLTASGEQRIHELESGVQDDSIGQMWNLFLGKY